MRELTRDVRTSETASRRVYISVRDRIVENEWAPGESIGEKELAAEYGVSRTPIRAALLQLEQDKLVTRGRSGRGYLVRPFDLSEMDEMYDVRISLEELALRILATQLTPERVDVLQQGLAAFSESASRVEALETDERFHLALAICSGNRTLLEFLEHITQRIHIIRSIDFLDSERRCTSHAEHVAILARLLDDDVDEASRLLKQHILKSKATCQALASESLAAVYKLGSLRKEEAF